ncbi:MAG: hypothetical protein ACKO54_20005, partial [Alphaproteobacteria bacterium]
TRKGWPSLSRKASAKNRATISFDPPGGKGTINRTGRSGQTGCARSCVAGEKSKAPKVKRREIFIIIGSFPALAVHKNATLGYEAMAIWRSLMQQFRLNAFKE